MKPSLDALVRRRLLDILTQAQTRGFVGPGPVDSHIDRALQMVIPVEETPRRAIDLGSGGGLPGLPLALAIPDTEWILLEGGRTRASFLAEAVSELAITGRVSVVAERAEVAGRGELRGTADLVVARSFGAPAVTAECASPFLCVGGRLLVAEPPGVDVAPPGVDIERWPSEGLAKLGMITERKVVTPTAAQLILQASRCPDRYPRRTGIPSKRPLF